MEILKLLAIIIIIAFLMWRKVNLGLSLLAGAALTGVLFGMGAKQILLTASSAVIDRGTIELIIAVVLIIGMGHLMKAGGSLRVMVDSLDRIVRDRRVSMVIPPSLIGLLPSPGGAMLSAPMVDESGNKLNLSPEDKTFINYWFRHLWEYFWPLYPGLIVAGAILRVEIPEMMRVQWPLSIVAVLSGAIFGLLPIKNGLNGEVSAGGFLKNFANFNLSIWPIWLILIGLMFLKLPVVVVLAAVFTFTLLSQKIGWWERWKAARKAVDYKIALLLLSVMIFKRMVTDSSAVEAVSTVLEVSGVAAFYPLLIFPFIVGLLTGVNQAYVGICFPLLLPFLGEGSDVNLKFVMFAYATGFTGVLLSPVHLCLLLTKEYYGAHWGGIYRKLIPAVALVLAASILYLFI